VYPTAVDVFAAYMWVWAHCRPEAVVPNTMHIMETINLSEARARLRAAETDIQGSDNLPPFGS
jgi:hypothetical protein